MSGFRLRQQIEQRLDDEVGTIYKEGPFRVSLVYPSPYNVGMSSLGYQTIYRQLNGLTDVVCERAFLPDDVTEYRRGRTPLLTYESQRPAADADVLAFSVAYEMEIIGLIDCLDLCGVPLRAVEREEGDWPLVILGGPLTFSNPLPVSPFADVVVMGEGEQLIEVLVQWYADSETREGFLRDVALLPGVYVPSIHGEVQRPIAQSDDDYLPAFSPIITPHTELSSMHLVENARGCHRGCTFCVMRRTTNMGMRAIAPERVLATIPDHARRVGLVGAATMDHPQLLDIMRPIVTSGRELGLSSLRADRLTDEFMELLVMGGAQTLTVASDGSSARMRKVARKNIKDKHLVHAAELVRDHGMRLLKLYMVIAYPEETMDDIAEMIDFVRRLSSICKVALGMSPLVAKKNTPLDGAPFEDQKALQAKIKRVQRELGGIADIRATSVRWAWLEYQMAQGGWDMADVAEAAWRDGASYGAWKRAIKKLRGDDAPLRRPTSERLTPGAQLTDSLLQSIRPAAAPTDCDAHDLL